jgi:hypothetical protein
MNSVIAQQHVFHDPIYAEEGSGSGNGGPYSNVNVGLSEAQTRRIISENSNQGQDHRWNIRNRKRPLELDATNCSLFVHGLHNDPSAYIMHFRIGDAGGCACLIRTDIRVTVS